MVWHTKKGNFELFLEEKLKWLNIFMKIRLLKIILLQMNEEDLERFKTLNCVWYYYSPTWLVVKQFAS